VRAATAVIATAGLALLATACGAAPASSVAQLNSTAATATQDSIGPVATTKYGAALAYSRCMRSHGVDSYPDPTRRGGGIQISGSVPGVNRQSPAYTSAQQACRHLLPGGGEPTHTVQRQVLTRLLHTSQCMRAKGVAGFPDPTVIAPTDRAGYSDIMSNDGVWLAIPDSIDVQSPAFRRAAATCRLGLS
jgi:hypothetical protein